MNLDARIKAAWLLCCVIVRSLTGDAGKIRYTTRIPLIATTPNTLVIVQVIFMPLKANPSAKKNSIQNALFTAGFSYPSIQDVTDDDGQHYVFQTTFEELM